VTRGTVINIHAHGALVRLDDGSLAVVGAAELAANRPAYTASRDRRAPIELTVERSGRHAVASLGTVTERTISPPAESGALQIDAVFEERMGAYLKETEAWAPPDRPPPAERHFIRKKRRAAFFEARNKPT
jgi:hypothetical protein